MTRACLDFRARLREALAPGGSPGGLGALAWREHLLGCAACRALLEAEEALEVLLESVDQPELPPDLSRRVLARLEQSRSQRVELDELLELDRAAVPTELAAGVLAALRPRREAEALDRLLERVEVEAPRGLAARVLAGLESERGSDAPAPVRHVHRRDRTVRLWTRGLALAAGLAGLLYLGWFGRRSGSVGPEGGAPGGQAGDLVASVEPPELLEAPEAVPDELLESLDLLESWDLLASDDLDLALNELDEVDLLILELESEG